MEATMEFLEQQRKESRPVLLHCFAGMNRSVALAAAYLVVKERMALRSAVRLLASKRGWVLSNDGFMRQLVRLARDEGMDIVSGHADPRIAAVKVVFNRFQAVSRAIDVCLAMSTASAVWIGGLLDCALSRLDSVIEEPDAHEALQGLQR